MEEKQNAIEVRNLSKAFKVAYDKPTTLKEHLVSLGKRNQVERRTVLENINLDIKKGETVALIGTNGSGKSTLLKLMTKILYPTKGTLKTYGKVTSLLELGAGFHPDFTGRENIYFNASIFGLTRDEIDNRIGDIIEFSELEEFIDNPIRTYSSGMYMRLAFSIAINVDADILLIDEILAVGDQHFNDKCYKKLRELRDSDKTIVIVSHSLDAVKDLCRRAIWIYKGHVQLDGDPNYVINEYLNQIALDHKETRKKQEKEGNRKNRGIVFIDGPNSFTHFTPTKNHFVIRGWSLCDYEDAELRIFVDETQILDYIKISRPDVIEAYIQEFAGFIENDDVGYECSFDISTLSFGEHHIRVLLYDLINNVEITDKDVVFYYDPVEVI